MITIILLIINNNIKASLISFISVTDNDTDYQHDSLPKQALVLDAELQTGPGTGLPEARVPRPESMQADCQWAAGHRGDQPAPGPEGRRPRQESAPEVVAAAALPLIFLRGCC